MVEITTIIEKDLKDLSILFEELIDTKTDFKAMVKSFQWIEKNADYFVLGAKVNGKLAGSVMGIVCNDLVGDCKPFMVIENVIVSNLFRGQGIGKKLMLEIERIARSKNCYYTMFVSGIKRIEAHKFYQSLGYKLDEVQGFKKYL